MMQHPFSHDIVCTSELKRPLVFDRQNEPSYTIVDPPSASFLHQGFERLRAGPQHMANHFNLRESASHLSDWTPT